MPARAAAEFLAEILADRGKAIKEGKRTGTDPVGASLSAFIDKFSWKESDEHWARLNADPAASLVDKMKAKLAVTWLFALSRDLVTQYACGADRHPRVAADTSRLQVTFLNRASNNTRIIGNRFGEDSDGS